MRQGYYIANGQKLLPWIKSAAGKKAGFTPAEYDYWWRGKPAARDLPGITGKVGDIKKGERREGDRSEANLQVRLLELVPARRACTCEEGERLPVRLGRMAEQEGIAVRGGGTCRPLSRGGPASTSST